MDQPQGPSSFDDLDLGSLLGDLPSLHSGQIAQLPDLGEEINVFGSSAQQQVCPRASTSVLVGACTP